MEFIIQLSGKYQKIRDNLLPGREVQVNSGKHLGRSAVLLRVLIDSLSLFSQGVCVCVCLCRGGLMCVCVCVRVWVAKKRLKGRSSCSVLA